MADVFRRMITGPRRAALILEWAWLRGSVFIRLLCRVGVGVVAKFRKKPVEIEAFQITKERRWDNSEWAEWLCRAWNMDPSEEGCLYCSDGEGMVGNGKRLWITTLEGTHAVKFGDWIIQGVKGELYPCKPAIFEATYDAA